jgi:organic radical activating enzyme
MEEFLSLQGEGAHTGTAAWFIRIGGCDVGCEWCDVKESWNASLFPPVGIESVVRNALGSGVKAAIITGGEPLHYNLSFLCRKLKANGFQTFLETSGSMPLTGEWDWICLSPKRAWPPRREFYSVCRELKVIIRDQEDLVWAELQREQVPESCSLYLQPEWSRREEIIPGIVRYIGSHPEWKLSLQIHKYIGIP